jgi:hypothetical protein
LSRWPLTEEAVSQSQLRHVEAKQSAQPTMVRKQPLREIRDRFPANAHIQNI